MFRQAAEQGYAPAQANLGLLYDYGRGVPQDDGEAIKWLRLAAEQGEPHAQNSLGEMYRNGYGVPRDYVLSYMWTHLSAQQGLGDAMANLKTLAGRMSAAEVDTARALAAKWRPRGSS